MESESAKVEHLHHLDVPPGHLHAIGAISVNFNLLESSFYFLIELFAPSSAVDYFFWELSNLERLQMLKHFSQSNADEEIAERVEAASKYFRSCFENRNLLMHSRLGGISSSELLSLATMKRRGELLFDLPLVTLQRVADEIWIGVEFVARLTDYIEQSRQALSALIEQAPGAGPRLAQVARSLPPIPAAPLRLDPTQKVLKVGVEI
ncbi:hypothetical protein [Bradyrhizobium sp. AZCC 2230]|uniref:hypothetical protein n=1 Tax=Bradyrhizobium sp. AZCC 2230 TaxID=3117021 RepID=UPI002FF0842A